jgi:acylglycerol lipase
MAEPFSYQEINSIPQFALQEPQFINATDGIQLAYYDFLPDNAPSDIVIFYHGGGAYSNAPYQYMGKQLAESHDIGTYMVDIRGHGKSGGARGDAPSVDQVFADITTLIDFVHQKHPDAKIYLAGHSSGAGLILNYGSQQFTTDIEGYICLAPYLGPNSGTLKEHKDSELNFVKKVRVWVYIVAGISGGRLCAHIPAVYFNYSPEILADPGMVPYYTYTMSSATTPYDTAEVFKKLHTPTKLYIGDKDEQFIPEKIVEYAKYKPDLVTAQIVPDVKHLSILLSGPELIAKAISEF